MLIDMNFSPELIAGTVVSIGCGLAAWAYNRQDNAHKEMVKQVAEKASAVELVKAREEFHNRITIIQDHVSREAEKAEARRERDVSSLRDEMNGLGDRLTKRLDQIVDLIVGKS